MSWSSGNEATVFSPRVAQLEDVRAANDQEIGMGRQVVRLARMCWSRAQALFESLMKQYQIPGEVVIRK